MATFDEVLAAALGEGRSRIGQVLITPCPDGGYELRHRHDAGVADLECFGRAEDAQSIAMYDDAGEFRALKSAPDLRGGWKLVVRDLPSLRLALENFYPAALGTWRAWREGRLHAVSLRQSVSRQTGMYRVAAKITASQAEEVAELRCDSHGGCLRTILWKVEEDGDPPRTLPDEKFVVGCDQTGAGENTIPLLCPEVCHLFVAAAREKVKADAATG